MRQAGAAGLPVPFVRTAPLTALMAYVGVGLLIFGATFQVTARRAAARAGGVKASAD